MPRAFSAWAKEQVSNTLAKCFFVDNSDLKSSSSGLRHRKSPSFDDSSKTKSIVPWDSLVYGELDADGNWLKLQDGKYLPVYASNGIRVLQPIKAAAEEPSNVGPQTVTVGRLQVPSRLERQGMEELKDAGPGAFYQVVAERVALRKGPSLAAPVLGQVVKGGEVELFGWDETRQWRRCADHRLSRSGWVLLDHPELGAMVRPLGEKLCVRPLNILAVAAAEGRLQDLDTFLETSKEPLDFWDPRGSALALAAERGQVSSCLRLLLAGATATEEEMTRIQRCREAALMCQMKLEELKELKELTKLDDDQLQENLRRKLRETAKDQPEPEFQEVVEGEEKPSSKASNFYEVCYSSVWIRREPHVEAAQVSKRVQGSQVNIEEFDESGLWGRVVFKTSEGMEEGWMLTSHPELGALLRPVKDTESVRPAG